MESKELKLEELNDEQMYCFVAPDGSAQLATLAPEFNMCVAMAELMASMGMSKPVGKMFSEGYDILPVVITLKQNGSAEDAFNSSKKS